MGGVGACVDDASFAISSIPENVVFKHNSLWSSIGTFLSHLMFKQ